MAGYSNRIHSLISVVALCSGGMISTAGCGQTVVTGETPAKDAEMKTVIINVFGMT